ncbi:MAG TPA: response regulator [Hyphomicrobiales bacterium]|nr:response regulator [Hyphomicrobiales bacterium]
MFVELKEQYRKSLQEKLKLLTELLPAVREGDAHALERLRQLAQTLSDSGTSFGFPEISATARAVENADDPQRLAQLPALAKALLEATARAPRAGVLAQRQILLVTQADEEARQLQSLLQQRSVDYQVLIASSGARARDLLTQHDFSLVLVDLVLPDMDGRVLLRELCERLGERTACYALAPTEHTALRQECLALGARACIAKPFDASHMAQLLAEALHSPAPAPSLPLDDTATDAPVAFAGPILLAASDLLLAGIIKHRLSREDIAVQHAPTGQDACELLQTLSPALIMLDARMPGMSGFDVLARLRETQGQREVPVLLLIAMGNESDVKRGYALGADDYLVKPFSPAELLARVRRLAQPSLSTSSAGV